MSGTVGEHPALALPHARPTPLGPAGPDRAPFGEAFTPSMATATWTEADGWSPLDVGARRPLLVDPAMVGLHYGQLVFEGMKAYRAADGDLRLFRPDRHAVRLQRSARRFAMPEPPTELFVDAVRAVAGRDEDWLPTDPDAGLYLRPVLMATEPTLALRPARDYLLVVLAFVTGGFFAGAARPISVWVETEFVRAVRGGTGAAKCAGNYAPTFLAQQAAAAAGHDQVVWLDAVGRESAEEMGGMNLFFVHDHGDGPVLTTPPLTDTILPGVTRDAVVTLAAELGVPVRQVPYGVGQWQQDAVDATLTETFACGTAAGVTPVGRVATAHGDWQVGTGEAGPVTQAIRAALQDAQRGVGPDRGWLMPVAGPVAAPTGGRAPGVRTDGPTPADEAELATVDLADPAIYRAGRQYDLWARLRRATPVQPMRTADGDRYWSVLSYDAVSHALTDHASFSSTGGMRLGADPTATAAAAGKMMVITDEPRHGKIRRVVSAAFTPRVVARLEQTMREIARDVVSDALAAGECDFADVAARLPVSVICDMLGVPRSDWDYMLDRTKVAFGVGHDEGHSGELAAQAHIDLFRYYDGLMRRRRDDPQEDIVSALVHGTIDGVPLTDQEIVLNCDGLISGGNETTRHATIGGMLALAADPGQWQLLRDDPALIPGAVQEILRYTTPAMHLLRTTTRAVTLDDVHIPAGAQVALWLGAANRDETRFERPLQFDVRRPVRRHLTFAYGPHFCIGSALATAELTIMFGELSRRVGSVRSGGEPVRILSNLIDGFQHVPLVLTPLPGAGA